MTENILKNVSLDTPIAILTPRQLFEMQKEWMSENMPSVASTDIVQPKRYAKGMSELADALGMSLSTCYRIKATGIIDAAISQYGRWFMVDIDKAIELLSLSRHRRK